MNTLLDWVSKSNMEVPHDPNYDNISLEEKIEAKFRLQNNALHTIIEELRLRNQKLQTIVDSLIAEKAEREEKKSARKVKKSSVSDPKIRKRAVSASSSADSTSEEGYKTVTSKKDRKALKAKNLETTSATKATPKCTSGDKESVPVTHPAAKPNSAIVENIQAATTSAPRRENSPTPGTSKMMETENSELSGEISTGNASSAFSEGQTPSDATNAPVNGRKPKPVVITEPNKWPQVKKQLEKLKLNYLSVKQVYLGLQIQPTTVDDFRGLTKHLREKKVQFHTWDLDEDKKLNLVIKGIGGLKDQDVKNELLKMTFHPLEVFHLKRKGGAPSNLIKVLIPKHEGGDFRKIQRIFEIPVSIETQKPFGTRRPCSICQHFGHSSRNCNTAARCVKCDGPHHWRDCRKPVEEPATCCNCGGLHSANYGGCPKNPKNLFGSYSNAAKNRAQTGQQKPVPQPQKASTATVTPAAPKPNTQKPVPSPRAKNTPKGKSPNMERATETAQKKVEEFFHSMQAQFAAMMAAMMSSMAQAMQSPKN